MATPAGGLPRLRHLLPFLLLENPVFGLVDTSLRSLHSRSLGRCPKAIATHPTMSPTTVFSSPWRVPSSLTMRLSRGLRSQPPILLLGWEEAVVFLRRARRIRIWLNIWGSIDTQYQFKILFIYPEPNTHIYLTFIVAGPHFSSHFSDYVLALSFVV